MYKLATVGVLLGHQVGEHQPTLPAGEALLVDHDAVALECEAPRKKNLELSGSSHSLADILPPFSGGFLASPRGAEHEDELVAQVQRHASEAHGMALSYDEAPLLAFRAELDAAAPSHRPELSHDVLSDVKEEE